MRALLRYVVLATVIFWLGGFTFYTSIVVPIGTTQLGRDGQGFITREVTRSINAAAVVALAALLVDLSLTADPSPARRWWRRGLWLWMAACQVALYWLHARLDTYLDPATHGVTARPTFYQLHRLYLWLHTVQWLAMLAELMLMLLAWRAEDAKASRDREPSG